MTTHAKLIKASTLPTGEIDPLGNRGLGPIDPGHMVLGFFTDPPTIGKPFILFRYSSNGVEVAGIYRTSPVTELTGFDNGYSFATLNSTYNLSIYDKDYQNHQEDAA